MRMHCFDTTDHRAVYIDLDQVAAVAPDGPNRALIYTGASCWAVAADVDDVLRLISPPAAPDTYEEDLAKSHQAIGDGISAAVRRMRYRTADGTETGAFGSAKERLRLEEEQAKSHDAERTLEARALTARLDEVEWMIANWKNFKPGDMLDYLFKRQAELVDRKRKAVA